MPMARVGLKIAPWPRGGVRPPTTDGATMVCPADHMPVSTHNGRIEAPKLNGRAMPGGRKAGSCLRVLPHGVKTGGLTMVRRAGLTPSTLVRLRTEALGVMARAIPVVEKVISCLPVRLPGAKTDGLTTVPRAGLTPVLTADRAEAPKPSGRAVRKADSRLLGAKADGPPTVGRKGRGRNGALKPMGRVVRKADLCLRGLPLGVMTDGSTTVHRTG